MKINSEKANKPEVENQCPERQRQSPVRYGQDEFVNAVNKGCVHYAAYKIVEPCRTYAGSLNKWTCQGMEGRI